MNQSLVSIIIPAYNASGYINECIDSILSQSYDNIEVLIADDCSTDDTKKLIDRYRDPRIKRHHNPTNNGVVKTRNQLIMVAKGEYIALQDADDWSNPDRVTMQVAAFNATKGLVGCGTGYNKITKDGSPTFSKKFHKKDIEIRNSIPNQYHFLCGTAMFKASYLKKNPYSDFFGNSGNEDLYLMGKLILKNKFINIPETLYNYRLNEQSLTKLGQQSDLRRLYINQITSKLLNDLRETGTNWIECGDTDQLYAFEDSLKQQYQNNKYLLHEHNIGQMLYWKQYRPAIHTALNNMIENGINLKTIKLWLYVCKQAILRK